MNAFKRPRVTPRQIAGAITRDAEPHRDDNDDAIEILVRERLKLEAERNAILENTKELNRQITMLDEAYERLQLVKKMNSEAI